MFGKHFTRELIVRSTTNATDRRRFLQMAGLTGLGVAGATVAGGAVAEAATPRDGKPADAPSDAAILNFALNLEYLEAEFYRRCALGEGLPDTLTGGVGGRGPVKGGRKVPFKTKLIKDLCDDITRDEVDHVAFLRTALGGAAVGRPSINIQGAFNTAAEAAGLIKHGQVFDPYANENNFLLGAFVFEDVGVTAYKGAAPLITNSAYLEAAAGILAVEAYHAGALRALIVERSLNGAANAIVGARDSVDGPSNDDRSVTYQGHLNLAPSDGNSIAFSRSAPDVLNVVYLTPKQTDRGGFFPSGVNGTINTSGDNG